MRYNADMDKKPRVALIHDYLNQYGGAEKTLEEIMKIFPEAPIFTGIYDPKKVPPVFSKRKVFSLNNSILSNFPKYLTFLMPLVFESFDLSNFDLIISDGTAWPKGVLTKPSQLHIAYVHTPPRFLYKYSVESTKRNAFYFKPFVTVIDHYLRIWDYMAAQRPDALVTNSRETRSRIKKFYRRDARVINPPVNVTHAKVPPIRHARTSYYIVLGRMSAYKNFDIVIKAFNELPNLKLVVVGTGVEEKRLKKLAKKNVMFVGYASEERKHTLIKNSLGLINAVEDEDFGIVPLEVMGHGRPVLAHKSSGHLETVIEGTNGMFFENLRHTELAKKIKVFDQLIKDNKFDEKLIAKSVQQFSEERFIKEFGNFVTKAWEKFNKENA